VILDNVKFKNVRNAIADNKGKSYLSAAGDVDTFVLGCIWVDQKKDSSLSNYFHIPRNPSMLGEKQDGVAKAAVL
jgi:hypothetical protein